MKKLLFALLFFPCLAHAGTITTNFGTGGGTAVYSQVAPRNIQFVQASSMTAVPAGALASSTMTVTTGNLLVAFCGSNTTDCNQVVTDTLGNTFTAVGANVIGYDWTSVATYCSNVYYAKNITGGSDVITCYDSMHGGATGIVLEYSGASASVPLDVSSSSAPLVAFANPISGSTTTISTNEMMVSFLSSYIIPSGSGSGTLRKQFTTNSGGEILYLSAQDAVIAAAGPYMSSWTADAQFNAFLMIQAAFK